MALVKEINKTDEAFQEEMELILKHVDKLVIGDKYKYPMLVEELELPFKKGKGKQSQIKRITTYLNWDSRTGLYSGIKKGADEVKAVMKKTTNSDYYEFVRDCLISNMVENMELQPSLETYTYSKTSVLQMSEIISEGYRLSCKDKGNLIASELTGINTRAIANYKEILRKDGLAIVESTLRQMSKQSYLTLSDTIILMQYVIDEQGKRVKNSKGKYQIIYHNATHTQRVKIKEIETEILFEMYPKLERSKRLFVCSQHGEYNTFRNKVCKRLFEKYQINVDRYFEAYLISPNKSNTDYNFERLASECVLNTKMRMCDKMKGSKSKALRQSLQENSFGSSGLIDTISELNSRFIFNDEDFNEGMRQALEREEAEEVKVVA